MKKGFKFSLETREKMRIAKLGIPRSQETKDKLSKFFKGRPNGRKGIPNPSKIGNNYSAGHIAWNRGMKMSKYFREKIDKDNTKDGLKLSLIILMNMMDIKKEG